MKALFCGAGSIGQRHIRDFYKVCSENGVSPIIHAFRRNIGDLGNIDEIVSRQITDIIDDDYDVAFITNPTHLHYDALKHCVGRTRFFFIEKPIFNEIISDISALGIDNTNAYVAAPMRHTKLYKRLKEVTEKNKVFSVRSICSSYLPEWRKGVDYRKVYSAKREMGGGVNLDLVHEIDYIYDLFGDPVNVLGKSGKYSDLEITSNDLSTLILEYSDKLCEIHLDYFGRKRIRICEMYTREGTYVADFYKETLLHPNGIIEDCHVMENEEFLNEMYYFYRFISKKTESINPPNTALRILQIALTGDSEYGE